MFRLLTLPHNQAKLDPKERKMIRMATMTTMTTKRAKAAGFRALTIPYAFPEELGMLDHVLADLRRGNIAHVLVTEPRGFSVWRRGKGHTGESRNLKPES